MARPLTRKFYERDPVTLAKALVGQRLVRVHRGKRLAGLIVEVEAYLGIEDRAAHTFSGRRTARNATMWGPAGHAYVYFTYGMHHCVNVVADGPEVPQAVLIRALEPVEGLEQMRKNRAGKIAADRLKDTDLCSGPAKLAQALAITLKEDGVDLTTGQKLFVERGRRIESAQIQAAPRIGVAYAKEWADRPLRLFIRNHAHVSRKA